MRLPLLQGLAAMPAEPSHWGNYCGTPGAVSSLRLGLLRLLLKRDCVPLRTPEPARRERTQSAGHQHLAFLQRSLVGHDGDDSVALLRHLLNALVALLGVLIVLDDRLRLALAEHNSFPLR